MLHSVHYNTQHGCKSSHLLIPTLHSHTYYYTYFRVELSLQICIYIYIYILCIYKYLNRFIYRYLILYAPGTHTRTHTHTHTHTHIGCFLSKGDEWALYCVTYEAVSELSSTSILQHVFYLHVRPQLQLNDDK